MRPFPKETLKSLRDYYRVGLTYTSNALEGNSLTESETKVVIEDGLTIGGKPLRDVYEATGHAKAYDHLYSLVKDNPITEEDILELHRLFYAEVDPEHAGSWRQVRVFISGSHRVLPAPEKVPELSAARSISRHWKRRGVPRRISFALSEIVSARRRRSFSGSWVSRLRLMLRE